MSTPTENATHPPATQDNGAEPPFSSRARGLSLRLNTAIQIGSKGIGILIALALSPFIVDRVGLSVFGFWALISALAQYASLLDLGVGATLTRFVAELDARDDPHGLERKAATGFWCSAGFATALVVLAVGVVFALPSSLTHSWPAGWQAASIAAAGALGVTSVASVFQSFAGGLARWDIFNLSSLAGQIAAGVATVVLLLRGGGLAALGLALIIGNAVGLLIAWRAGRRLLPVSLSPRHVRRADLREIWGYGMNLQVAGFVKVVNAQSDKFVLLAFADLKWIGLYELGSRVAFSLRSLPVVAFGPMVAAAAREAAADDLVRLRHFYRRMLRATVVYGVAPLAAIYGACYPLVIAWLGPSFRTSAAIAALLGVGYTVNIATGAGTSVANGSGKPQFDRNYSLLGLVINLVLTFALGLVFGPWGVIAATTAGLVLSTVWLMRVLDRWLGERTVSLRNLGMLGGDAVLLGTLVGCGAVAVEIALGQTSRPQALAVGVLAVIVYALGWITLDRRWSEVRQLLVRRLRLKTA